MKLRNETLLRQESKVSVEFRISETVSCSRCTFGLYFVPGFCIFHLLELTSYEHNCFPSDKTLVKLLCLLYLLLYPHFLFVSAFFNLFVGH